MARVVHGFRIGARLGSGTQGRVYQAFSEATGEEVALKVTEQSKLVRVLHMRVSRARRVPIGVWVSERW